MVLVELVVAGGVVYMVKKHRKKNRERAEKEQYEYAPLSGGGTANVAPNSQPYINSQGGVGSYGVNGGTANKI